MAGATKPQGTAWKRRRGTPSEQVREDLDQAIKAKRAREAATPDNDMSADFTLRLAKAQAFAKQHGLKWEGPCTHMMAVALVEQKAVKVSHILKGMAARIAELEKVIAGQQKHVDHLNRHALRFSGEWQPTATFYEGCVVAHKGALYTALKQIPPGKSAPSTRDGSGWALMA